MRAETHPWWRQAQADITLARATLEGGHAYSAAWFCQQAAEKGLKALYIEQRLRMPPRTHDLDYLGRETGVPAAIAADLRVLNPTFDIARYPDPTTGLAPVDRVSMQEGADHLVMAERIMQWIGSKLSQPSTPT
jgi:HEPN domain-containing protein